MHYATSTSEFNFLVSLHSSIQDSVVSKGIREGLFGPAHKYPSIDEMHAICQLSNTASCNVGKVFVEVGAALGMVSIYMASRGMTVYAYDPLMPNIERLSESRCLNRERWCRSNNCNNSTQHFFSPQTFHIFWNAVGSSESPSTMLIESEPNNLAATMRGGGSVKSNVHVATIDDTVNGNSIEVMLLTCQGAEFSALLGASNFLKSGKVRNIIWRVHAMHSASAIRIAGLLEAHGYWFYKLEEARSSKGDPTAISYEETLKYIAIVCSDNRHANIWATLQKN